METINTLTQTLVFQDLDHNLILGEFYSQNKFR